MGGGRAGESPAKRKSTTKKKKKKNQHQQEDNGLPTIEKMQARDLEQQQKQQKIAARGQNPATQKAIDGGSRTGTPSRVRTAPAKKGGFRGGIASRQSLPDIER
jgi:hypothetical protein